MRKKKKNNRVKTDPAPVAAAQNGAPPAPAWARYFVWTMVGAAVILAFWAMFLSSESIGEANRFSVQGWGEYGTVIVGNKIIALWHAAGMTAVIAGFLALCVSNKFGRWKKVAAWLLVVLVALDTLWLARHYVKTMPMEALKENDIVRILRAGQPEFRAAMVDQGGFYNLWLTYLFPYHGIQAINVAQMPRMPNDYKNFLEAVSRDPVRMWRLMAVGHILAPAQFWVHVNNDQILRDMFELVYAYNVVAGTHSTVVQVVPATPDNPGQHAVIRMKVPAPRWTLMPGWRATPDAEALQLLGSTNFALFKEVLVAPEWADDLPPSTGGGMTGLVQQVDYRPGYTRLSVSAPAPCILRIAEKYDPDWKAWVNEEPVPVRRVDYIFQGILIEPGLHEVVLRYSPAWWSLAVQIPALLVCLIAAIRFTIGGTRRSTSK